MKNLFLITIMMGLSCAGCKKTNLRGEDVYPKAERPIVDFLPGKPQPNTAGPGADIKIDVEGLAGKAGKFKVFISQVEAQVVDVTNNTLTVTIPENAISGNVSVFINDQLYYGPFIRVSGDLAIDETFKTQSFRANDAINGIIAHNSDSYLVYGKFYDYAGNQTSIRPVSAMAVIYGDGSFYRFTEFSDGLPRFSTVTHMEKVPNGYLISGGFSRYKEKKNITNIVRVLQDGTLDEMVVDVVNPDPINNPNADKDTVSAFNAGVSTPPVRMFLTSDKKIILAGNFRTHTSTYYPLSTRTSIFTDAILAPNVIRVKPTGTFDSTYNFDYTTNEGEGANGYVVDAVKLPNDDVIVVGDFTNYQSVPSNRIAKISASDGRVTSFNVGETGSGADSRISRITRNPNVPDRYVLSGPFKYYNGQLVNGVVVIDGTGKIVPGFQAQEFKNGLVDYAAMLTNGNIIVSGTFTHYGDKVRPGLAILSNTGELIYKYNRFGMFRGKVNDIMELKSGDGVTPAVFLVGEFDRFDNIEVGNIVKIKFLK